MHGWRPHGAARRRRCPLERGDAQFGVRLRQLQQAQRRLRQPKVRRDVEARSSRRSASAKRPWSVRNAASTTWKEGAIGSRLRAARICEKQQGRPWCIGKAFDQSARFEMCTTVTEWHLARSQLSTRRIILDAGLKAPKQALSTSAAHFARQRWPQTPGLRPQASGLCPDPITNVPGISNRSLFRQGSIEARYSARTDTRVDSSKRE